MTPLQLELTQLIGKKELTFGCFVRIKWTQLNCTFDGDERADTIEEEIYRLNGENNRKIIDRGDYKDTIEYEIIGHPATISDFHRWMNGLNHPWSHSEFSILIFMNGHSNDTIIPYDSSKDLLDQNEETLKQIINLIRNNQ